MLGDGARIQCLVMGDATTLARRRGKCYEHVIGCSVGWYANREYVDGKHERHHNGDSYGLDERIVQEELLRRKNPWGVCERRRQLQVTV